MRDLTFPILQESNNSLKLYDIKDTTAFKYIKVCIYDFIVYLY